jgi:hypothetical protein
MVILCGLGTVLFSVYNVLFFNCVGQWFYCVVLEQCYLIFIFCGFYSVLLSDYNV